MEYDLPEVIQVEADGPVRVVAPLAARAPQRGQRGAAPRADRRVPAAERRHRRARRGDHRSRARVLGRRRLRAPGPDGERSGAAPRRDRRGTRARAQHDPLPGARGRGRQRPRGRPRVQRDRACPTSCTWPSRPTCRTRTSRSASSRPTAARSRGRCTPSLLLAKEYAFTGDRISATRAAEIGLANHVCPDDEVLPAGARGGAQDRRAAPSGGRGDQAGAEPPPGARGAGDDRLRDGLGERVVRHPRAPGERRPVPRRRTVVTTAGAVWPPRDILAERRVRDDAPTT